MLKTFQIQTSEALQMSEAEMIWYHLIAICGSGAPYRQLLRAKL
jgi:hypothetical protein